jgi:hypothetical protein
MKYAPLASFCGFLAILVCAQAQAPLTFFEANPLNTVEEIPTPSINVGTGNASFLFIGGPGAWTGVTYAIYINNVANITEAHIHVRGCQDGGFLHERSLLADGGMTVPPSVLHNIFNACAGGSGGWVGQHQDDNIHQDSAPKAMQSSRLMCITRLADLFFGANIQVPMGPSSSVCMDPS